MKQKEFRCPRCREIKPRQEYHNTTRGRGTSPRRRPYCRECQATYMVEYRKQKKRNNPEEYFKQQRKENVARYGITTEDYQMMFNGQNGKCLICNSLPNGTGKKNGRLFIDHCHENGNIRGLLCHHCNAGLGAFKHNPELLLKAIEYLKNSSAKTLAS